MGAADIQLRSRRALHRCAAVDAVYTDDTDFVAGVDLKARWTNKSGYAGGMENGAEIISTINRVVFDDAELAEKGITLRRGGVIAFASPVSLAFELDVEEERDGPVNVYWSVTRTELP